MIPTTFHFLRPEWLLAFFPALAMIGFAWHQLRTAAAGDWRGHVDPHLMAHLAVKGAPPRAARSGVVALGFALTAMILAMAGPAWEKLPVPAYGGAAPTVIVLSLSQSMNSTDLVPSRIARAGHKLRDILDQTEGSDVALVIYADRPFVAAPLTSDAEVIRQMLPELSTGLMPVLGNRLDLAIGGAQGLLSRAGGNRGRIVVLADDTGLDPAASLQAAAAAKSAGYSVSVMGVGTTDGADLQTAQGQAIRAADGSTMTTKLDVAGLTALARSGGGAFSTVTADGSDLATLLPPHIEGGATGAQGKPVDMIGDSWADMGYLLLLLPVLLAPFAFRRGLLFALPFLAICMGMAPSDARAETWTDLWKTPDQQGQAAFTAGDFAKAADLFVHPDHKAAASYRAGDFVAAATAYGADRGGAVSTAYNLGNSLAKSGKFEEALIAYDKALATTPTDPDIIFNRDLVAKLLEQQQQDQKQSGDERQDPSTPQDGSKPDQAQSSDGQKGRGDQTSTPQTGDQSDTPENSQPSPAPAQDAEPNAQQAAQQSDLKETLDEALDRQNGAPPTKGEGKSAGQTPEQQPTGAPSTQPLNQATEQQLRAVPDDPSGLLRARIHQYYTRLRATGQ